MSKKNKYDTAVVLLYLIGKEDLLPYDFRKLIPYSTISSWRKADYTTYIGHEYRHLFIDRSDYVLLKRKYEEAVVMLKLVLKAWLCMQDLIIQPIKEARTNTVFQKKVLNGIGYLKKGLGLKRALKIFGISHTLYSIWSDVAIKNCTISRISLCPRKYPRQLHHKEVDGIKAMLTSPKWEHWPIVSIAALALRKKKIVASLFSWYKYARLFNIGHDVARKKRHKIGLQSEIPNEYLHIDTTYYALNETQNVCITFVMDNFSKMILSFAIRETLSFRGVKEALSKALKIIARHPDQRHPFLVADGGSENHNKEINDFIAKLSGFTITKIRALKDIKFSNSPVEAIHKIMKGRYLRNARFERVEALDHFLDQALYDYNELRPHYKHSPRTPHEVYFGTSLGFNVKDRIRKASKDRVAMNRKSGCSSCVGKLTPGSCVTSG